MSEHEFARRQALITTAAHPSLLSLAALVQRDEGGGASCRLGDASCATAHAARLHRSARGGSASLHRSLRHLQRDYGNRFVGQVLRQAASGAHDDGGMDAVERSIDGARGGGQQLDHATQRQMESSFGADFSAVRIHHDARADGLSQALSARAFTTGRDVFFRQGEYSPGTSAGRELLAHELTHVVQQNGSGLQRKMTVSEPGDPQEVEADRMARQVIAQEHAARQPEAPKPTEDDEKRLGTKPLQREMQEEEKAD